MQNELKTAIRFDDFYAAFRSQGIVAIAWWLGALHADRIRAEHHSFPLLHIEGRPGCGKTFLLSYLWKLIGQEEFRAFAPEYATPAGRARALTRTNQPVIVLESEPNPESTFDWDELRDLYNGGTIHRAHSPGIEAHHFHGALVIISSQPIQCSANLESRIARVRLGTAHTIEGLSGANALRELSAGQAGVFGLVANQHQEQVLSTFNKLSPAYTTALTKERAGLCPRAAKNGGQLMALVDALSLMLGLTNEQRVTALGAVKLILDDVFSPL